MPQAREQSQEQLSAILQRMVDKTDGEDEVSLGDLVDALKVRSYGPMLLLPALLAASPIGAIPGMSFVTGTLVILIAGQMLMGKDHPWIPKRVLAFSFDREKLVRSVDKTKPVVKWIEKYFVKHRVSVMTRPPVTYVVAFVCIVLAVLFYPLALIPMAVLLPAGAVLIMAFGLSARDGVWVTAGLVIAGAAGWMAVASWPL